MRSAKPRKLGRPDSGVGRLRRLACLQAHRFEARRRIRRPRPMSRSRPVSPLEVDRRAVDEGLVSLGVGAPCDGQRLAVGLGNELARLHVGHPDLDWAQPLGAKPFPASAYPSGNRGTVRCHVRPGSAAFTCNSFGRRFPFWAHFVFGKFGATRDDRMPSIYKRYEAVRENAIREVFLKHIAAMHATCRKVPPKTSLQISPISPVPAKIRRYTAYAQRNDWPVY